jgi:hypothetical protein
VEFLLFLLVNFILFVRPSEMIPELEEVPIYNILILATLAAAAPRVIEHLRPDRLSRQPITICVLGLLPAIILSHLATFDVWRARMNAWEFSKVVIYYLILISVVNSTARLRTFLYSIALFAAFNSAIAILQFYEFINVPALEMVQHAEVGEDGELNITDRLRATGIFNDPNDLSTIAVVGIVICIFGLSDRALGLFRVAWLIPFALLIATIALTKSRGGLLAFVAAAGTLSYLRLGLWKTVLLAALFVPVLGATFGGRQTNFGDAFSKGTGNERIEYWSQGIVLLKSAPVFGIGHGRFQDEVRHVAHNAFVHSFVELGVFGGTFFIGAFWFAGLSLLKLGSRMRGEYQSLVDPALRRMQPYFLSILAGYGVSLLSLSRSYVVPTYLVLGVVNAYCLESRRQGLPTIVRLDGRRGVELLFVSLASLVGIYLFIKFSIR